MFKALKDPSNPTASLWGIHVHTSSILVLEVNPKLLNISQEKSG